MSPPRSWAQRIYTMYSLPGVRALRQYGPQQGKGQEKPLRCLQSKRVALGPAQPLQSPDLPLEVGTILTACQAQPLKTTARDKGPQGYWGKLWGLAGSDSGPATQAQEHLLAVKQEPVIAKLLHSARCLSQHAHSLPGGRQEGRGQIAGGQQQGLRVLPPCGSRLQLSCSASFATGACPPPQTAVQELVCPGRTCSCHQPSCGLM